jgi:hypothetical protein
VRCHVTPHYLWLAGTVASGGLCEDASRLWVLIQHEHLGGIPLRATLRSTSTDELNRSTLSDSPFVLAEPLMPLREAGSSLRDPHLHYDYLPVNPGEVRLLVLTDVPARGGRKRRGWSFTVHTYRARKATKGKGWSWGKWAREAAIEVAFKEPFQALAQGDDYYLVTASGRLYRAPKPAKGADRRNEAVWDDGRRPIVAFIRDADAHRTFLFCKQAKGEERPVYFELSPKPKPKPYDLAEIKEPKAKEPLRSTLRYARWLDKHKLLGKKGRGAPTPDPSPKAP